MEELRCVIVDDEPYARKGIAAYIEKIKYLKLVGAFEDVFRLNDLLKTEKIDLVFLDIEMPEISGLDFLASLRDRPLVIVISAYEKYALRGYELEVVDYLLKPVPFDRFFKAANKAFDRYQQTHPKHISTLDRHYFFVKVDKLLKKVYFENILFLQAFGNYTVIQTIHGKEITYSSLQHLVDQLPKEFFIYCHRSYVVNISNITAIEGNQIVLDEHKIPIARNLKEELLIFILKKK